MKQVFPFSAIVGQDELKIALILTAIDPTIGGVLAFGDRGTGKTTTIRALASLLPPIKVIKNCRFNCDPINRKPLCDECRAKLQAGDDFKTQFIHVPVVDLPLGVTEDRVVGALDIEKALTKGEKAFEVGLLAKANRGFLYIDEVNLLEDHIVDLLLDVAASGENIVEREGMSLKHPARFVLIGSGNPEEGELRPQLLDRFGLSIDVKTPLDLPNRIEIIRRRDDYERDPKGFARNWRPKDRQLRRQIADARKACADVVLSDAILERIARLCLSLGTDGLRGELTMMRTARAFASFEGKKAVTLEHLRKIALMSLRHRLRRDPLDGNGSDIRIELAVQDVLAV